MAGRVELLAEVRGIMADQDRLTSMWSHIEWCYRRAEFQREQGCPATAAHYERAIDAELEAIEKLQGVGPYKGRLPLLDIVDDVI